MNNYEFEYGLDTVVRVNKKKARAMYNAGKMIVIYMVNDSPESPWCHGLTIKKDLYLRKNHAFDAWVNEFEYYYSAPGRGSNAKFFVKTADLKKGEKE